ncbi:ABC transporter ATP-binding protein [Ameyamaea chiangmaiensis NBRC 103196]|uniref:ABC transporter ATP-binding protein n=1 Tax=Ameyamaea chiangmaiensis TaxID=442969 RepID=A0A850PC80_9PROT|nr:ABC transporter ATP-binding protein [Ameyamaea chiangmaiensis]MBS4074755.1 ABC transporter ATP-binding protein [Ameyamaea chiangmaiensis]NVN40130.1 ABC transporter ATP-binding protein [Ameyamaea chiangmaiensis]GBQ62627.1 ABC transporter ATP-binding protein [Ameyamaea chiangmaiensis NBRC 103196]
MTQTDQPRPDTPARRAGRRDFIEALRFVAVRWLRYPGPFWGTVLGVGLATVTDVVTPVLAGRVVADVAHAPGAADPVALAARHDAILMLGGLLLLGLVGVLGRRLSFIAISHLTLRVMSEVASTAFARVQRFSTDWHANTFAGSTVRRLTRGMWAIDALDDTLLLLLLPEAAVLGGTTLVLGWHWPFMGVLLAVMTAVFATVSVLLTLNYVAPSARQANRWDTRVGATLADALTCNPVVKAFGAETREDRRLARVLTRWRGRTLRSWVRGTDSGNIQNLLNTAMRISLIACAIILWWAGKAGPGDVAYILTMVFLVQGYLRDIGQQVSVVQRSVNEMEELVAIFARAPDVADHPGAGPLRVTRGEIRFDHVGFTYAGQDRPLFDGLTLTLAPGSRVALVGSSGSGKTTLTKLLQRLYDIQRGTITIDGTDIADVTQSSLREQIAIVPQEPILFHRTLAENIAYGRPGASMDDIREAARLANAADFVERLPQGYDTLVGERGVKLSGGERQRVAIARAFIANARILVFDEATSSLDSESEKLVQDAMERLMEGRTVIVIAHRLSTVIGLDRILVFSHGHLREDGSHAALVQREGGIYRRLFELQSLEG